MRVCPKCGYKDNPQWRHSRFDFNADYMRFDEAEKIPELEPITKDLKNNSNFVPCIRPPYSYYRRGTGGIWLYRVASEDFRVPRERKRHIK
jgi:hypothetical protein